MSSKDLKTRLESQFCRMNCQMFSWPLSSGARGGSGINDMLLGTFSIFVPCQPVNKISKWKVPLPGGQSRDSNLYGLTALRLASVHCCAPRGLIARSFATRCTVPVPIPSDLATFKIPTPFASCFRTFRSVAPSIFGRPSFTP